MKTSVGLTNGMAAKFAEEVSRLYKTKPLVKRSLTTNSQMAEQALEYFFNLPEQDRDVAFAKVYAQEEAPVGESI